MSSNNLKNWRQQWEDELESEKKQLEKRLGDINSSLSKLRSMPLELEGLGTKATEVAHKITRKKINKKDEIYKACNDIKGGFTSNDIKNILKKSDNEEVKNITVGYISAQLCKLAQEWHINIIEKGKGKGSPNIYSKKDASLIKSSIK